MTHTACDKTIAELADVIESAYKGADNLVAMIATDVSRVLFATTILGSYGHQPNFQSVFAKLTDASPSNTKGNEVRLSAVREALGCLARGKYKEKVAAYMKKRTDEARFAPSFSNMMGASA